MLIAAVAWLGVVVAAAGEGGGLVWRGLEGSAASRYGEGRETRYLSDYMAVCVSPC